MGKLVDDIMFSVLGQVNEIRKKALKEAIPVVKKGMKDKVCDRAVMEYYMDYFPTKYKRTYSLFKLFKTYARQDGNTLSAWIEYDNDRLPQYTSNSPRHKNGSEGISRYDEAFDEEGDDNGIPEKDWIFDNFWNGVHPRFYIDREMSKLFGETVVMDGSYHFRSTESRVKQYANEYEDTMREVILNKMMEQL